MCKQVIAIIDYGVGNLNSIRNMLLKVTDSDIVYAKDEQDIIRADKLILPGVGAFDYGMSELNASGMREELDRQITINKKTILGICLGMQMLGKGSEEGKERGLSYVDFSCKKFKFDSTDLKIPHMGWDYVEIQNNCDLLINPVENARFYFVHSFYAVCNDNRDVMMTCDYGTEFAAGIHRENIYGVQFHPEKSHRYGKWILDNFANKV